MAQKRGSLGFIFPKGPLLLSSNTGSFTLHSDQSFPSTPSQLCSRTGIDPREREEKMWSWSGYGHPKTSLSLSLLFRIKTFFFPFIKIPRSINMKTGL